MLRFKSFALIDSLVNVVLINYKDIKHSHPHPRKTPNYMFQSHA